MRDQGGGEPKTPDIGKAILLADAVVIIDDNRDYGTLRTHLERTQEKEGDVRVGYVRALGGLKKRKGGPCYRPGHSDLGYLRQRSYKINVW